MKTILLFFSAILFFNVLDAQTADTIAIYDPAGPKAFISTPPNDIFNTRFLPNAFSFSEVYINQPNQPDTADKSNLVVFKNQLYIINKSTFRTSSTNEFSGFSKLNARPLKQESVLKISK